MALVAGAVAAPPPTPGLPDTREGKAPARKASRLPKLSVGLTYAVVSSLAHASAPVDGAPWLHYRLTSADGNVVADEYV